MRRVFDLWLLVDYNPRRRLILVLREDRLTVDYNHLVVDCIRAARNSYPTGGVSRPYIFHIFFVLSTFGSLISRVSRVTRVELRAGTFVTILGRFLSLESVDFSFTKR